MGTRSLASLFVFRAFVSWKRSKADQESERLHPFLALEEPEAHLHPHAQRAVFSQKNVIYNTARAALTCIWYQGREPRNEIRNNYDPEPI
jgi:putative ATP-dependent endonuclease of OLD family